jgi:hypothetical protein
MNKQVKIIGGLILGGIAAYFIFRPKKTANFSYPSKEMFGRGGFSSYPNAPQSQPYSVTVAGADGSLTPADLKKIDTRKLDPAEVHAHLHFHPEGFKPEHTLAHHHQDHILNTLPSNLTPEDESWRGDSWGN